MSTGSPYAVPVHLCDDAVMAQDDAPPPDEPGLDFLRELVDRYGVDGLTERLAAAIEEAEAGRVTGPALEEATAWIEQEHGSRIPTGTATGSWSFSGTAVGVAPVAIQAGDHVAVTLNETARIDVTSSLPTNMEILARVQETFFYLVGLWGLLDVPPEVIPFALLMALAIVVVRIRVKQRSE